MRARCQIVRRGCERVNNARCIVKRRRSRRQHVANDLSRGSAVDNNLNGRWRNVLRMGVLDAVSVYGGSGSGERRQGAVVVACIAARLRKNGWLSRDDRECCI